MSIFNILRKKEKNVDVLQQASATLYPERILIQTYDRAKEGGWIGTTNLQFIASDVDDEVLGSTIRHYMSLTRTEQMSLSDWKDAHKLYLKAAGFKTQKEEYKDAKNASISRNGIHLTIDITINGEYNGKTRGFWGNGELKLSSEINNIELGQQIREAWELCK